MRIKTYVNAMAIMIAAFVVSSCLEGDEINTPPGGSAPFIMMTNNANGGPAVYTGLRYFPNQALLLNPTVDNDTVTFAVTLQGVKTYAKDINITLSSPEEALDDYFDVDEIPYEMLPAEGYTMLATSGVIPKGQTYAEFKIVLHPSQIDLKKNYMIPITASNDAGITVSSNYNIVYYHMIGNPIAGLYDWEFIRYATPDGAGDPDIHTFDDAVFAPVNGTTVTVPTGYYTGPNYIITFDDDGAGNLSNFKAVLDPDALAADWGPAGIEVVTGPTITVNADYTQYTIKYTTKTRNVTDIYTKK